MTLPGNQVRLIDLIGEEVRRGDAGRFLERFLQGEVAAGRPAPGTSPQEQFDATTAALVALPYLLDPFRLPERQGTDGRTTLDYALWAVGFTDELEGFTARLTAEQKRLLLRSATALWKAKGLPWGWLRWIRLLTGRSAWYANYFHWRHLLDEDLLGETALLDPFDESVPGSEVYGAYESDLYVEDPQDAAMRQLIVDLVDLTRQGSERVRVRWPDVLETWERQASLARWARYGINELSTDDKELYLEAEVPVVVSAGAHYSASFGLTQHVLQAVVRAEAENVFFCLDLHWSSALDRISLEVDFEFGFVRLVRVIGGGVFSGPSVFLGAAFPVPGADYLYQVSISDLPGGGAALAAHIDGVPVASWSHAGALVPGRPGITVWQGSASLGRLLAYDSPLGMNFVAPTGAFDDEA